MLTKWLSNSQSKIPCYCNHHVGSGGAVIDFENKKILMVQDSYHHGLGTEDLQVVDGSSSGSRNGKDLLVQESQQQQHQWQIPSGQIEFDEELEQCAGNI